MITFFVEGKPVAKQSFRYAHNRSYQRKTVIDWQSTIALQARVIIDKPIEGNLVVSLYFFLPNRRRVDIDNLCKAVLDGLNKVAWMDDSQITKLVATKAYFCEQPGVMIEILEV